MKLEKNMYVRTKDGEIGKVISNETIEFPKDYSKIEYLVIGGEITKASNNIIDLIEVGDYVNGSKVEEIFNDINGKKANIVTTECYVGQENMEYDVVLEEDIKSIVTKEQFESMQYKVD